MGCAPGSIAHAQAQIDAAREQALNDAEQTGLQEDSQTPDDVEALLNEMARDRNGNENGPADPLGWITPEHQGVSVAIAENPTDLPLTWADRSGSVIYVI